MYKMRSRRQEMSEKQVRGQYTQEFKLEAVRQVKAGESMAATAKVSGAASAPSCIMPSRRLFAACALQAWWSAGLLATASVGFQRQVNHGLVQQHIGHFAKGHGAGHMAGALAL